MAAEEEEVVVIRFKWLANLLLLLKLFLLFAPEVYPLLEMLRLTAPAVGRPRALCSMFSTICLSPSLFGCCKGIQLILIQIERIVLSFASYYM